MKKSEIKKSHVTAAKLLLICQYFADNTSGKGKTLMQLIYKGRSTLWDIWEKELKEI